MKSLCAYVAFVCLAAGVLMLANVPNMYAQTNNNGLTGTDPGVQNLPALTSNTVTCTSSNNPNHVVDAAAANPHNQPVSTLPIPLQGLSQNQLDLFCAAVGRFQEIDSVAGVVLPGNGTNCTPADLPSGSTGTILCVETGTGLGPRFNGNSCAMCHFNPVFLGASATLNPQATQVKELFTPTGGVGVLDGGTNSLAAFNGAISPTSPIREVRFIDVPNTQTTDGNVHQLFTITGRVDATNAININPSLGLTTCTEQQPDFTDAVKDNNVIYRIPIIAQGDGLVELIDDENLEENNSALQGNGVTGTFNRSGNDGTITRFGWKAQNKSLAIFSGEAYNVEQGVTNDLFPNERRIDDDLLQESMTLIADCQFNPLPDDSINFVSGSTNSNEGNLASQISTDVFNFSAAMRLSAPPTRAIGSTTFTTTDLNAGALIFTQLGCNQCHANNSTQKMVTIAKSSFPANQNSVAVQAFSDFAIHTMASGPNLTNIYLLPCLDDQVQQGGAFGNEFRSAPLWGTATRTFFLHDGRTSNLGIAILSHACSGSEANNAANGFAGLTTQQQNQLMEYLRTL
jgi:CxxC motif-containing protein (DUF1111 family)